MKSMQSKTPSIASQPVSDITTLQQLLAAFKQAQISEPPLPRTRSEAALAVTLSAGASENGPQLLHSPSRPARARAASLPISSALYDPTPSPSPQPMSGGVFGSQASLAQGDTPYLRRNDGARPPKAFIKNNLYKVRKLAKARSHLHELNSSRMPLGPQKALQALHCS